MNEFKSLAYVYGDGPYGGGSYAEDTTNTTAQPTNSDKKEDSPSQVTPTETNTSTNVGYSPTGIGGNSFSNQQLSSYIYGIVGLLGIIIIAILIVRRIRKNKELAE